jgi:AmiR/NasT family two-component response regulator
VATIFGAAVEEAVRNADLAMATRGRAERAADDLRRDAVVDQAVGVLIAQRGSGVEEARATLADAAARAGISQVQAAEIIVQLRQTRQD